MYIKPVLFNLFELLPKIAHLGRVFTPDLARKQYFSQKCQFISVAHRIKREQTIIINFNATVVS